MPRSIRLIALGVASVLAACTERTGPSPDPESLQPAESRIVGAGAPALQNGARERLARRLALALADPAFRAQVRRELDRSPIREHKLHLQRFLTGAEPACVEGRRPPQPGARGRRRGRHTPRGGPRVLHAGPRASPGVERRCRYPRRHGPARPRGAGRLYHRRQAPHPRSGKAAEHTRPGRRPGGDGLRPRRHGHSPSGRKHRWVEQPARRAVHDLLPFYREVRGLAQGKSRSSRYTCSVRQARPTRSRATPAPESNASG